jgi:hypothetical protein
VRLEPRLRGSGPGSDIELEHITVSPLPEVCRLLRDRCGERDRGTPDAADRELRLRRRELDDEDLAVRPSLVQPKERSRFVARSLKMWQEMCFRVFRDPTRVRHQFGELG